MTTDLEKQFFDTFGIEPDTSEVAYFTGNMGYPPITDRHYLELLCIFHNSWQECEQVGCWCHKNNGYQAYGEWLLQEVNND